MPIIDLQRRLTEVGRIRIGQKVPTGNGNRMRPDKLDRLRFTSPAQHLIAAIAEQLGGEARPWQAPSGPQFEVITEAREIPVYVPPQNIDPWYELWGNGYMQRKCDGQREAKRDAPCMCSADRRECKPTTRISVMLADVPGLGVWRLESHGWNAAAELSMLTEMLASAGAPLPARLLIQPRQQKVLKSDGKIETRDFMVPILLFDAITSRQIQGGAEAVAQALSGGPQRQAIESTPAGEQPTERKRTAQQVIAMVRLTRSPQQLQGLTEAAQAVDPSDPDLPALKSEWQRRMEMFKEADTAREAEGEQPAAPSEVVNGEVEPDADRVWSEIVSEAGKLNWDTSMLERKFGEHTGVASIDADGFRLAAFLTALRAGQVK